VADFMGEANVLDATLDADRRTVRLSTLALTLAAEAAHAEPGPVKLAVRPHAVKLLERGGLTGTVLRATYLGDRFEYEVSTPLGMLFVVCAMPAPEVSAGTEVGISLDAARGGVAIVSN